MKRLPFLLIGIALAFGSCRGVEPEGIWFDDLRVPLFVNRADTESLGRFVQAAVRRTEGSLPPLPPALVEDRAPRIVFLAFSDGTDPARVVLGSGLGLTAALESALARAKSLYGNGRTPAWMMLDVVTRSQSMGTVILGRPLDIVPGLHGIAFERHTRTALVAGQLVGNGLMGGGSMLRPARIDGYAGSMFPDLPRLELAGRVAVPLHRFETRSVFTDGRTVLPLYRGHRTFRDLERSELLAAARRGGEYLVRATRGDGRFAYSYEAAFDFVTRGYNVLRHAGTVYAMLELYEVTRDGALLEAASRAIRSLLDFAKPCPPDTGRFACVVARDRVKLGGNALAVVALAEYTRVTGDRRHLPAMQQLAGWIVSVQGADGAFTIHKQQYSTGRVSDFVSQYYPGEALLALLRLFAIDGDERWLDAAERGALHLIQVRDAGQGIERLGHDHWLLYALRDLYRHRPSATILDHAMRIAEAIVTSQNRKPRYPDWLGSYYVPPRSTPAAVRSEGLVAAHELARETGKVDMAVRILQAIELGVAFQLQTQFRPESAFWLQNPPPALGGFHHSLTSFEVRIDYVQHNISALLGLYRIVAAADPDAAAPARGSSQRTRQVTTRSPP